MTTDDFSLEPIDLGRYMDPKTQSDRDEVIAEVLDACRQQGFFAVKGHGVPRETQEGMIQGCRNVFNLPREEKQELSFLKNITRRGYEGSGDSHREGDKLPDSKEAYYIGREEPVIEKPGFHGPNVWPNLPSDKFRDPATEYYAKTSSLGKIIWEILIQGLGHSASLMDGFAKRPIVVMKMIRYPPQSSTRTGQFGVGPHTDFGGVTVLLQQPGREGLEVWHETKEEWVEIPAPEDIFIINVGDMMQRWSGGQFKSAKHRVINKDKGDGERISIATFWHGDVEATNPFNPEDSNKETVGELLLKRFGKQFSLQGVKAPAVKAA